MAEYMRLPANSILHKVPKELPLEKALLSNPTPAASIAWTVRRSAVRTLVVLSGAAHAGLGMVTYARSRNPKLLIVLDYEGRAPRTGQGVRRGPLL
jgi:L-iditol 2-dehydrogenase